MFRMLENLNDAELAKQRCKENKKQQHLKANQLGTRLRSILHSSINPDNDDQEYSDEYDMQSSEDELANDNQRDYNLFSALGKMNVQDTILIHTHSLYTLFSISPY
jgi:hypothetical protein